jgi:hypothetical protein
MPGMTVEERRQMLERKYDTDQELERREEHAMHRSSASASAAAEPPVEHLEIRTVTAPGQFPAWVQQALTEKQQRERAAKEKKRQKQRERERRRRAALTEDEVEQERAMRREREHERLAARTEDEIKESTEHRREREHQRLATCTEEEIEQKRAVRREHEHRRVAFRTEDEIEQDRKRSRLQERQRNAVRTAEEIEETRRSRREYAANRRAEEEKDTDERQERRRKGREQKRAARARDRQQLPLQSPLFASDHELNSMLSTGRFGICSPAVKCKVFDRACHSLGSHGMGKKVCAVCDALVFQSDIEEQLVTDAWLQRAHMKLRADDELRSNPFLRDYYNAAAVHGQAARCLEDFALSPKGVRITNDSESDHALPEEFDSASAAAAAASSSSSRSAVASTRIYVNVCSSCRPAMRTFDSSLPMLAIANGFYVGEMPPDLRGLSPVYWRLVSLTQATPLTHICRGGGNHQLRAHVHIWGMPEATAHPLPPVVLPRMLEDEAEYFKVVLAGPFTDAQTLLLKKQYTVEKSVLYKLFNWLCENNYTYREKAGRGEFAETNFDRIPDTSELQFHRVPDEKIAERLREPESVHSRSRDTEIANGTNEEKHFQQTTSAMISTVIAPSERFEIPLFAHRRSTVLIRDQDAAMLPYVFLRQLPYGYPKPEKFKTLKGVSYQRLITHFMQLSSGCFTDAIAILMAFNSYARAKAMKSTRFQLQQALATRIDSLEEADMVRYTNYLKHAQQSAGIGQTVSEAPPTAEAAVQGNILPHSHDLQLPASSTADAEGAVASSLIESAEARAAALSQSNSSGAKALWQQVRIRLGMMPLTNEERQLSRNKAWSMVNYFGNPHLFITLSVNELGSLTICSWTAFSDRSINVSTDLSKLKFDLNFNNRVGQPRPAARRSQNAYDAATAAAAESNADMEFELEDRLSLPSRQEIAKTVYEHPFEAAEYFTRIVEIFFHDVCGWDMHARRPLKDGGLFGHVKAFFGNPETAGRGGLHLHLLLWLHGMPRTEAEFEQRKLLQGWHESLIQWLDSFNRATLPIFQPVCVDTKENAADSEAPPDAVAINAPAAAATEDSHDQTETDQPPPLNFTQERSRDVNVTPRCSECEAASPLQEIKLPQSAGKRAVRGVPEPAVAQCPGCEKKYTASDVVKARIDEIKAEIGLLDSDAYSPEAVRQRMALPLPPTECRPLAAERSRHSILHHQLLTSLFLLECNVHDYRHFESCFKKSKTAPISGCRFRMPRAIHQGQTEIQGGEVVLQRRLGSNWLNPYVDVMIDLFRFNHDCRALIGSYASQMVYYVVKYISKDQKAVDQRAALDLGLQAFRSRRERDAAQQEVTAAAAAAASFGAASHASDSLATAADPSIATAASGSAARLINAMTYQLSNMQETSAPLAAYYLLRGTLEYTSHELPKLLLAQAEAIVCGRSFEGLLVPELRQGGRRPARRSRRKRSRYTTAFESAAGRENAYLQLQLPLSPNAADTQSVTDSLESDMILDAAASDLEPAVTAIDRDDPPAAGDMMEDSGFRDDESNRLFERDEDSRESDGEFAAANQQNGIQTQSEFSLRSVKQPNVDGDASSRGQAEVLENGDIDGSGDEKEQPPTYHSITQLYDYMHRSPLLSEHSLYSYVANFRKVPMGRRKYSRNSESTDVYFFKDEHVQHVTHVNRRRPGVAAVPLLLGAGSRLPDTAKLTDRTEDAEKAREAYARKALILFRPFQRIEELKSEPDSVQVENELGAIENRYQQLPTWWDAWAAWSSQNGDPAVHEAQQHLSFMQEYWNGKHVSNDRASEIRESWLAQFTSDAGDNATAAADEESEGKRSRDSEDGYPDSDTNANEGQDDGPGHGNGASDFNGVDLIGGSAAGAYFPGCRPPRSQTGSDGTKDCDDARFAQKAIRMGVHELRTPHALPTYAAAAAAAAEGASSDSAAADADRDEMAMEIDRENFRNSEGARRSADEIGRLGNIRLETASTALFLASRDFLLLQQSRAAAARTESDLRTRISAIQRTWPHLPAQWQDITRLHWPRRPAEIESKVDTAAADLEPQPASAAADHAIEASSSSSLAAADHGADGRVGDSAGSAGPGRLQLPTERANSIRDGILCYPSLYEVAEAMSLKEEQQAAFVPPAQRLIDYFQCKYNAELQQIRARSRSARHELPVSFLDGAARESEQHLQYIGGVGGAGKSHVVKALVLLAASWGFPRAVKTIGPTGVSAVAIGGSTIHRALGIHVDQYEANTVDARSPEAKEAIKQEWNGTAMLVIDEISMVGAQLFAQLSKHLGAIFSKPHVPFGGIHIIVAGDFLQLPPVIARGLCRELKGEHDCTQIVREGRELWRSFKKVYFVNATPNPRFTDQKWGALCDRARLGELTAEDVDYVNQRFITSADELWDSDRTPITLYSAHVNRFALNLAHLADRARHHRVYRIRAKFSGRNRPAVMAYLPYLYGSRDDELERRLPILDIYIGMRVMVTANIAPHFGVANGTIVTVYDIQWKSDPPTDFIDEPVTPSMPDSRVQRASQMPDVIYVQLSDPSPAYRDAAAHLGLPSDVFPILSSKLSVRIQQDVKIRTGTAIKTQRSLSCQMQQFPLAYMFAQTIHKVQGCTLDCVIAGQWTAGAPAYVMLSRVRKQADFACLEKLTMHKASTIRPKQEQLQEHLRLVALDRARREHEAAQRSRTNQVAVEQLQSAAADTASMQEEAQVLHSVADEF